MQFTAREDIDVPIEHVFEMLSDFERFERAALRQGAEVTRLDELTRPGAGACWQVAFNFRGKLRDARIEITDYQHPTEIDLHADIQGISSVMKVELVALSRTRTRLALWTELSARSLASRLLLQSLKLARGSLTDRLDKRVKKFGRSLEERFAAQG